MQRLAMACQTFTYCVHAQGVAEPELASVAPLATLYTWVNGRHSPSTVHLSLPTLYPCQARMSFLLTAEGGNDGVIKWYTSIVYLWVPPPPSL